MTEEKRLTLSTLEQHLAALQDIEYEVSPEQEAEFQLALKEALTQAIEKRDAIAAVLFGLGKSREIARSAAGSHQEEAERLMRRATRYEKNIDRLTKFVLSVMRELPKPAKGPRRLEGATSTLKANGVAPSVEVLDESQVPLEYKRVTVKMSANAWAKIKSACLESVPELAVWVIPTTYEVDRKALLEALKRPCEKCEGRCSIEEVTDHPQFGPEVLRVDCPKCNGTGKQLIPGARLESDKLRLVID